MRRGCGGGEGGLAMMRDVIERAQKDLDTYADVKDLEGIE